MHLIKRPRRLRVTEEVRSLVRQNRLSSENFIYPMFVCEGSGKIQPIETMVGQNRYSVDTLVEEIKTLKDLGITSVNLFGYSEDKDDTATGSYDPKGLIPRAIKAIKKNVDGVCVQTDIALDPYTNHGHDGLVVNNQIVNDPTIKVLTKMALAHANAGVDMVAPSDMMDGRIGAIRQALDKNGYENVSILAYSAKYASSFYGPFRGALNSAPKKGDKKTYQMDPANSNEAIKEIALDIEEGADIVMVKPALMYLDIIAQAKAKFEVPIAAYNVSGEYAMIKAAAEKGWLDENATMMESLICIKRAGADMILTYFAKQVATILNS